MSKLVCGAGFNDKARTVFVDGKKVKEYSLWQNMLERCYSLRPDIVYINELNKIGRAHV